jgi:hypothetical protein
MNRGQAWFSHVVTLAVGASGIVYFWMKYFIITDDPFSLVNHPLQPHALSLHLLTAPLLVFAFGLIFESHIANRLRLGRPLNRRSGILSALTFALMTGSGYALQVTAAATITRVALVLHLTSSGLFLVSYLMHQVVTFKLWRARTRLENQKAVAEA